MSLTWLDWLLMLVYLAFVLGVGIALKKRTTTSAAFFQARRAIIPLMAGGLFGVSVLGRLMGIVLTADGVAEATAPMLVGYLRDRTGSYNIGFVSLVAIALVGAAAIPLLPGPAREAQSAGVQASNPEPHLI